MSQLYYSEHGLPGATPPQDAFVVFDPLSLTLRGSKQGVEGVKALCDRGYLVKAPMGSKDGDAIDRSKTHGPTIKIDPSVFDPDKKLGAK